MISGKNNWVKIVTEQLKLKLNKDQFSPLLEYIKEREGGITPKDSTMVGKCVFFLAIIFLQKKFDELDGLSMNDFLLKKLGMTEDHMMLLLNHEFSEFKKRKH